MKDRSFLYELRAYLILCKGGRKEDLRAFPVTFHPKYVTGIISRTTKIPVLTIIVLKEATVLFEN